VLKLRCNENTDLYLYYCVAARVLSSGRTECEGVRLRF
jgi:hypothetical protein